MQVLIAVAIVLAAVVEFQHIIGYVTFGIIAFVIIRHEKRKKGSNDPKIPGYMIGGYFSIAILFLISTRFITKDMDPFSLMNIALDEVVVLIIGWILWVMVRKTMVEHVFKDGSSAQG
jgi:hypothetical protein